MRTPFPTSIPFPIASCLALVLVVFASNHHWLLGIAAASMAFVVFWIEAATIVRATLDCQEPGHGPLTRPTKSWSQYQQAKREERLIADLTTSLRAPAFEVSRLARMGLDGQGKAEHKVLRQVERSTDALLDFLEDENQLADLREGTAEFAKRPFSLERAISRGAEAAAEARPGVRANLRYHISREVPADVCGDERRLTQLLRVMSAELLPHVRDGVLTLSVTSRGEYFGLTRLRFAYRAQGAVAAGAAFSPRAAELCQRLVSTMGGVLCLERQLYADAQFEIDFPVANGRGPKVVFESLP